MNMIMRFLFIFTGFLAFFGASYGAVPATSKYIKPDTYNYMYPYMNNQMRTDLNPGITPSQSTSPMDVVVKTTQMSAPRRVVSRTPNASNSRRVAPGSNTARSATNMTSRGVVARTNTNRTTMKRTKSPYSNLTGVQSPYRTEPHPTLDRGETPDTTRSDYSYTNRTATNSVLATEQTTETIPSSRCMAEYTKCMDDYCSREETRYNRCYCSAKLSQIDSTYQPAIDELVTKLIKLKYSGTWSDEEFNEYWMDTIGKYYGENSWVNLENALNIDWAGTESRVRGQQSFIIGHDYCIQHLQGCFYMVSNLRDAYRSEIARDCAEYEQSLMTLKSVAETVVESYND